MKGNDHLILSLETSTAKCSAALSSEAGVLAFRETSEPKAHASSLAPFVKELMDEVSVSFAELDAVAVSGGPGSYTGLRVGVSTAKGICFGCGKPLVSVGTLEILAYQALESVPMTPQTLIVPMVDARRMEVYTQEFSSGCEPLTECRASILDGDSYLKEASEYGHIVFIGDGVRKYHDFLTQTAPAGVLNGASFIECCPDARAMQLPALRKFLAGQFEDPAYYEPFYLKEFVAGVSRKGILTPSL